MKNVFNCLSGQRKAILRTKNHQKTNTDSDTSVTIIYTYNRML